MCSSGLDDELGRYVLEPRVFDVLAKLQPGALGEIQLTDALDVLRQKDGLMGCKFAGRRVPIAM